MDNPKNPQQQNGTESDGEPNQDLSTFPPILNDVYVSGTSFPRIYFYNRILMAASIVLCCMQCLASGLLLSEFHSLLNATDWSGDKLFAFTAWFPEIFGGIIGFLVSLCSRGLLDKAKEAALRAHSSSSPQNSQKAYIPWSGAPLASSVVVFWMVIAVPTLISFGLFVVSAIAFATSVRVVKNVRIYSPSMEEKDMRYSVAIVLVVLHCLIVLCKIVVLVFGAVVPLLVCAIVRIRWRLLSRFIYPFSVFLDDERQGKPLLIEM